MEIIKKWWNPQPHDVFIVWAGKHEWTVFEANSKRIYTSSKRACGYRNGGEKELGYQRDYCYPLLSIGQMIEFLGECRFNLTRYGDLMWRLTLHEKVNIDSKTDSNELCDILWAAVKEELKGI